MHETLNPNEVQVYILLTLYRDETPVSVLVSFLFIRS